MAQSSSTHLHFKHAAELQARSCTQGRSGVCIPPVFLSLRSNASAITAVLALALCGTLAGEARAQDAQHTGLLSLHDAIEQSQSSPQAQAAQDQVDAANGLVTQAKLRPNPRIYLQSEDIRPWADNFDFPTQTEDYGYLGQLVELGGKRASRLGVARANVRRTEAERTMQLQQLAGRVAAAYWTAVSSAEIVRLLEEDAQAVARIVAYNKARVDAGAMRGVDLIRMQIEQDRIRLALESAKREASLARIDLFRQIGRSPDPAVQLSDKLEAPQAVAVQTLATVLAARADVAAAREAVSAAEADVKLQHSLGVPDLDLLGGYKRNSGANTLYTGLQLPLAFRNRNQGEVARAEADARLAKDRLRQIEINVSADVEGARVAYTQEQAVVKDILPDMRARAQQNLSILDDAYRSGGVDLLRYLDAERTAFDVEVSALRTLAEFQQATLRLQLAYGVHP